MKDRILKWGFKIPEEFNQDYKPTVRQKKLDQWIKNHKAGQHIIFTDLNLEKYQDLLYLVWRLTTTGKVKNFIGLVNLGDLVNAPFADRRDLEVDIQNQLDSASFVVFEDFDLYPKKEEYISKAHWATRKCMKQNISMILSLTGDESSLNNLVGTTTYLKFIEKAVQV